MFGSCEDTEESGRFFLAGWDEAGPGRRNGGRGLFSGASCFWDGCFLRQVDVRRTNRSTIAGFMSRR